MKEEPRSVDLTYVAKPEARYTTGRWNVTQGEVPAGGVFIGTLSGGYTIWADGRAGDDEANATLISAAALLLSAIESFLETTDEGVQRVDRRMTHPLLKAGLDDDLLGQQLWMGKIKLRAAVSWAYRQLKEGE